MEKRKVIAVDIDEVLCDFMSGLVEFHNTVYKTSLRNEDFLTYEFQDAWGGTMQESVDKVHDFFETEIFKSKLKPVPDAKQVLLKLAEKYELHCVTSRQNVIEKETREFIDKHYPSTFKDIHFGNHYLKDSPDPEATHVLKRSKADICKAIGACCLIDDSTKYANQCAAQLDKDFLPILFGSYSWNQNTVDTKVQRCLDWKSVLQVIESKLSKSPL